MKAETVDTLIVMICSFLGAATAYAYVFRFVFHAF